MLFVIFLLLIININLNKIYILILHHIKYITGIENSGLTE